MTARANTSIRLSADEKRRLLEWGPDVSAAVRRVLAVADAAWAYYALPAGEDDTAAWSRVEAELRQAMLEPKPTTTRELVRERMRPGRTAGDIARMLGMTRQAVQWHMRKIREGA